ncbi:SO_0444 family Cu/Zn efflux transporter [Reinekea marinisedimentorum]|uniref:Permease n=1 Tax=Reinekea marinisedimentorum TaxID=230495 RepID=A0A4R3I3R7_9GAMM|nr:SO_0444 family Cu/Zn efflux transporter [Reinekea marinisedimentorum]TCS40214.1 hypothetical protein BCF53_110136 [Reinekea marinisedimentorum]
MSDFAAIELLNNFLFMFTESAPFLLLGLFLAGVIHMIIPSSWVEKTLGKGSSVITAAVIGAPIPLCSCSVIPTAIGIRRSGATKASTASFMVATPETGVDSVGVTYALMGPVMAVIRPVSAVLAAIFTGTLVRLWDTEQATAGASQAKASGTCCSNSGSGSVPEETSSCCSSGKKVEAESPADSCCSSKSTPAKTSSCCSSRNSEPEQSSSCCSGSTPSKQKVTALGKLADAAKYGFGKLLGDFMKWLLIGLFFAAVIKTFVPDSFLASHGSGIFAMAVMVLVSVPMYICATASTPIAAGLMLSGISPGAALVFMMAGPATNIATIMVVKNELGVRSVFAYLVGVIGSAMVLGLTTDAALNALDITITVSSGEHGEVLSALYSVSALVLAGLIVWNFYDRFIGKQQHAAV